MKICRKCNCSEARACMTTAGRGCRWSPMDPTLCTCCTGEEQRLLPPPPAAAEIAAGRVVALAAERGIPVAEALLEYGSRALEQVRAELCAKGYQLPAAAIAIVDAGAPVDEALQLIAFGELESANQLGEFFRTGIDHARKVDEGAFRFSSADAAELYEKQSENPG